MALTLAEKMIVYRAKHNISQIELANRCHVSSQTIYMIESGQQTPSRLTETKIRLIVDEEKTDDDQCTKA